MTPVSGSSPRSSRSPSPQPAAPRRPRRRRRPPPVEQIVNEPDEVAFPDEADAPEAPPEELEAAAPEVEPLAPAVVHGDVIARIRGELSLPQVDHPRVDREIEWLQRNPDYLARVFGRAQRYLHHIANEVEAQGLPGDLALLPVVESAFNPFAYSRAHASGLWQFIAPTGERYGLRRNYYQDQRRDVLESTRGALEFLTQLNDRFDGDWFLAIAAYNYGPGNVQRAINRNLALGRRTDFFSLSLPAETRAYVPKLVALAKMVRDPERYGFYLPPIPDTPYFRVVPTGGPVDLRLMAELAGVDTEELHALNPSWNRWITDPDGPHRVLVPEVVADGFTEKLAALDGNARARLAVHTVAPGESFTSIAGRYKVPESFVDRMNAGKRADLPPGRRALGAGRRRFAAARRPRRRHGAARAPGEERRIAVEHLAPLRHDGLAARAHEPHLDQVHAAAWPAPAGRGQRRQRRFGGVGRRRHAAGRGGGRQGELQGPARRHALGHRAPLRGHRPRAAVLE